MMLLDRLLFIIPITMITFVFIYDYYRIYFKGEWGHTEVTNPFMYCWDESFIDDSITINPRLTVYLSFDFNVDPITCSVHQYGDGWYYTLKEYNLNDSNTEKLCERIKAELGHCHIRCTGDSSGWARKTSSRFRDWEIVQQVLKPAKIDVTRSNPNVSESRTLSNTILGRHPNRKFHSSCYNLIEDMRLVRWESGKLMKDAIEEGRMVKTDLKRTHLLDTLRYMDNTYFANFIEKQKR